MCAMPKKSTSTRKGRDDNVRSPTAFFNFSDAHKATTEKSTSSCSEYGFDEGSSASSSFSAPTDRYEPVKFPYNVLEESADPIAVPSLEFDNARFIEMCLEEDCTARLWAMRARIATSGSSDSISSLWPPPEEELGLERLHEELRFLADEPEREGWDHQDRQPPPESNSVFFLEM